MIRLSYENRAVFQQANLCGRAAMGLTYIAVVAFVVVLFLELLVLVVFILVEVVVGVPGAADAAVGLEEAHVRLE